MTLRDARLPKKTTFQALKDCFFPRYSLKLKEARLCKKNNFSGSKTCFFPHGSYETQRSSALQKKISLQKIVFCALTSKKSYKHGFAKKNIFSGSKKLFFFPYCSHETQTSPALQKSIFQALKNNFFACLLSNLPTATCYLV
jgi:hypothetical protein